VSVAIVDYGSGNLHSAAKAFEKAPFGVLNIVTADDPDIPPATAIQTEAAQRARLKPDEKRNQQRND